MIKIKKIHLLIKNILLLILFLIVFLSINSNFVINKQKIQGTKDLFSNVSTLKTNLKQKKSNYKDSSKLFTDKCETYEDAWTRVAIHEGGHALFSLIYQNQTANSSSKYWVSSITIGQKEGNIWGLTKALYPIDKTKNLKAILGGHFAEIIFFGKDGNWDCPATKDSDKFKAEELKNKIPNLNIEKIEKEIKKTINKPRNIKIILLLAEALLISKELNKEEVLYIYKRGRLTDKIRKQKNENNKLNEKIFEKDIYAKLIKYDELEKIYQNSKTILNFDILHKNKEWTIDEATVSFDNLIKERKEISTGSLSDEAIEELNFLKKTNIKIEKIKTQIEKEMQKEKYWLFPLGIVTPILISMIIAGFLIKTSRDENKKENNSKD